MNKKLPSPHREQTLTQTGDTLEQLSRAEEKEFNKLNQLIDDEMDSINSAFASIGRALRTIRDRRLYRSHFSSFEKYVEAKLRTRRNYGYRLIAAANMTDELLAEGFTEDETPKSERLGRELLKFEKSNRGKILKQTNEKALAEGIDKPTIEMIREAAAQLEPDKARELRIKELIGKLRAMMKSLPESITWEALETDQATEAVALLSQIQRRAHALMKQKIAQPAEIVSEEEAPIQSAEEQSESAQPVKPRKERKSRKQPAPEAQSSSNELSQAEKQKMLSQWDSPPETAKPKRKRNTSAE